MLPLFKSARTTRRCSAPAHNTKSPEPKFGDFVLCAGQDLNLRSPKASDLQSDVIDHSTTDALPPILVGADKKLFVKRSFLFVSCKRTGSFLFQC